MTHPTAVTTVTLPPVVMLWVQASAAVRMRMKLQEVGPASAPLRMGPTVQVVGR